MQVCGEERGGAMAAILGLEDGGGWKRSARSLGEVWLANYNSPGSGRHLRRRGPRRGGRLGLRPKRGARRVVPLVVSGAFHTPLMAGAAEALAKALSEVTFLPGTGALLLHHRGARAPSRTNWPRSWPGSCMSPVKFSQSMEALLGGRRRSRPRRWRSARATCSPGLHEAHRPRRAGRCPPETRIPWRKAIEAYGAEGGAR